MYQPPLYYILAAVLPKPETYRYIGLIAWVMLGAISYPFFKKKFTDKTIALAGTVFVISTPAVIYLTPAIGNEFFSAVIISDALVYYLMTRGTQSMKEKIILGLLLGLAMLAKATAFVLIAAIILDQIIANKTKFSQTLKNLFVPFLVMTLLGGWYYIRNVIYFRNPFATSVEFPPMIPSDPPADRGFNFWFTFRPFLTHDFFLAHHYSFLGGTYFSWFYDGHNAMVPVQEFSKIGFILVLASIPLIVAAITGYITEIKKITDSNRLLLMYPILLLVGYILYNFKIPYMGTVKAIFLLSAVIPFVFFILKGIEKMKLPMGIVASFALVYVFLIIKNFWVNPEWYRLLIRP